MEAAILQPNKPPLTLPVWKMAEAIEKEKYMIANKLHQQGNTVQLKTNE